MTHNLLLNYGLYRKMEVYRPHKATQDEMTKFHSDDYIRFLRSIRPDNMSEYSKLLQRFNVGEDSQCSTASTSFANSPVEAVLPVLSSSTSRPRTLPSTGPEASITPRRARHLDSAMSTTLSLLFLNSSSTTRGCCTLTSTSTTEMESRRPSTPQTV